MPYFALIYHVVEDYVERRTVYRSEHLSLVRDAHSRGELVLGGAFAEPPDTALLVWRVPDRHAIEDFVRQDPYVQNGLVARWEIREWTVVVGEEPARR